MNAQLARTLTPERRFYLAAARLNPDPAALGVAAARVQSWEAMLREVRQNLLAPLVARSAQTCSEVPEPVKAELRKDRLASQARGGFYMEEAAEVLRAFVRAGLQPVVLKGLALIESHYRDPGLRPFCDADLLLPLDALPLAENVLAQLRYRPEASQHSRAWYLEHYYQLPRYARRKLGFCVELHWDFGRRPNPFRLEPAQLIARSDESNICGVPVRRLNNEDLLAHLILHLVWGNGFDGHVRGLVDVAEVVRSGVDWDVFLQRVLDANMAQAVAPALELAAWLLDAPVPAYVAQTLNQNRGGAISRAITTLAQSRILQGGRGHRMVMRLAWLRTAKERFTMIRQNVGSGREGAVRAVRSIANFAAAVLPNRSGS